MMPLLSMTGRKGRVWGRAWNCAPAVEAIIVELRGISDDGGADTLQVLAFSTHGQPFGPVLFAVQRTVAQHCGLLEQTPPPANAEAATSEGEKEQKAIVEACRTLVTLADDPQPGLSVWHIMCGRALDHLREVLGLGELVKASAVAQQATERLAEHMKASSAAERRRELLSRLFGWRGKEVPAGLWADVEQELNAKEPA